VRREGVERDHVIDDGGVEPQAEVAVDPVDKFHAQNRIEAEVAERRVPIQRGGLEAQLLTEVSAEGAADGG
jgi:hypothetical protein